MTLVEVQWTDSAGPQGWVDPSEVKSPGPVSVKSVGYLARDTKVEVMIVQSCSDNDRWMTGWGNVLSIPRSCVRRVRRLK